MEGGSKSNINLEAGLDITSSDMLVPVGQPTFQHNWQKFQGKFLPNSLRYEQNGWAAGWNVYSLDYKFTRIKAGDKFVGKTKLNDNPTYMIGLYDSEDSADMLHSVCYNKDLRIVSVRQGTAVADVDSIDGSFNGNSYVIRWDEKTKEAVLETSDDLSMVSVLNNDYTTKFTLTDEATALRVDMDLYFPSELSGTKLYAQNFGGFDGTECEWNDFSYDVKTGVMKLPDGSVTVPVVSDVNKLTFSFSEIIDESFDIVLDLKDKVTRFDNCVISPDVSNENLLIVGDASKLLKFDKLYGSVVPNSLVAEDLDGIVVQAQVAAWATLSVHVSGIDVGSVRKPDNTEDGNVMVYVTVPKQKATATSCFGPEDVTEFKGTGWQPVHVPARYCKISLTNAIRKSGKWQPYKYAINSEAWCFSSRRFSGLTTDKARTQKLLGGLYSIGSCVHDYAADFDYNDIWDNIVSSTQDISGIRSVKAVGEGPSADNTDDLEYVHTKAPSDQDLLDEVCEVTGTYTLYSDSQESITASSAYADGTYTGGTYEEVGAVLASDSTFWPFKYVPCFNLEDVGKCYYADESRVIIDLGEYKAFVLGYYDSGLPLGSDVLLQREWCRTREVVKYRDGTDFDYVDVQYDPNGYDAFNERWESWYPRDTNPCTMTLESSTDTTYEDYVDIEMVEEKAQVKYVPPSVKLDDSHRLFTLNKYDIMLYDTDPEQPTVSWKVFHHTVDRSDLYETVWEWNRNLDVEDSPPAWGNITGAYSKVRTTGYTFASLNIDGTEYSLPYLKDSVRGSLGTTLLDIFRPDRVNNRYSDLGYNYADLTKAEYYTYSNKFNSQASQICCTVKAKDMSPTSEAWADYLYYNTPFLGWSSYTDTNSPPQTYWYTSISYHRNGIELAQGLQAVTSRYAEKTVFGAVVAVPVYANVGVKVRYPEVKTTEQFSTEPYTTIVTESVPDDDPRVDKDRAVWLDRSGGKCLDLFELEVLEAKPLDTGSTSKGYMKFSMKSKDPVYGYLFYAKKLYNSQQTEITASVYCPGIAYDEEDFSNDSGNMLAKSDGLAVFNVSWNPTIYTCPVDVNVKFSNSNSPAHSDWKELSGTFRDLSYEVGKDDFLACKTPVYLSVAGHDLTLMWDMVTESLSMGREEFDVMGTAVSVGPLFGFEAVHSVPVSFEMVYPDNTARFPVVSDGYTLLSMDNAGKAAIDKDGTEFSYNWLTQQLRPSGNTKIELYDAFHHVVDDIAVSQQVVAVLPGAYDGEKDGNVVKFIYDGKEYAVDLEELERDEGSVSVYSTDIRTPDKTRMIGSLDISGEYQLVKQQWNSTVEVENFWWVNSKHILVLDNYDFTLKRKTSEVDDWDGDRWEKIYEIPRADVLKPQMIRWFSCNVYGSDSDSLFVTLESQDGDTVRVTVYDVIKEMSVKFSVMLVLNKKSIGQKLNDKFPSGDTGWLSTYNSISASALLSQGKWSNTIVDGKLLLGCSLSKNYDQWTSVVDIDTGTVEKVVQGYGCVGLNGCLTGGQVPSDYFDENFGFNDTVRPVSYLTDKDGDGILDSSDLDSKFVVKDLASLNVVEECVVGTSDQQWYVKKTLYGIVSHLEYAGDGNFIKKILPVTNNFCASYKSPSFGNVMIGDTSVQISHFNKLINLGDAQSVWDVLMNFSGHPMMYTFAPRKSSLAYLQQTLGQYAYVHYNSTKSVPEDRSVEGKASIDFAESGDIKDKKGENAQAPVLSDAMTFGKQVVKQSININTSTTDFVTLVFFAFADALQVLHTNASVNAAQNQSAVSDTGKKYTQAALENLSGMLAASILTQSSDSGMQSAVVGLKSLDMFYSTSDSQNVFAGPGFVEHQFVADCVAQSTIDVHIEGQVQQLTFVITALTYFQLELTSKILDFAMEQLTNVGNSLDQIAVCGTSVGAGMATKIPGFVAKIAGLTKEIGFTAVKSVLEVLAAKGVTCTEQGRVTHHEMNNEAKHKYGEKSEFFMWPCWGIPSGGLSYSDEHVECGVKNIPVEISLPGRKHWTGSGQSWTFTLMEEKVPFGSSVQRGNINDGSNVYANHSGTLPYYQAACYGVVTERTLPEDMAKIEGVSSLLPSQAFKNENIGASEPTFAATMIHDYVIDKSWNLSMCCTGGLIEWITCKDTKLINGAPSNMYVNSNFCGVASPYTAVEVKRGISKRYMRPWAVTPNVLALNVTGYNSVLDNILYHAFDGISYRIVELTGSPGLGKQRMSWLYAFQLNDRFKRSNKCPPAVMMGNFEAEPVQYVKSIDKFWTVLTVISKEKGLANGAPGEDKDVIRWSVPVFTEPVTTLPAAVKTLTAVPLVVVDGITGLATDLVSFLSEYKAPLSVDFTIGKNVYRMTEEYICSVETTSGIDIVKDLVPALGLTFIGASPTEAYFYSRATRCYYVYTGGTSLTKMDMMERFRNVQKGYWDFVNQEVVMPCLMTFKRLNKYVEDKDTETDNIIVPVMSGNNVSGELPPPLTTIFNDRSWYKAVSLPCGFAYQGPNRVIINRNVFVEYMLDSMKRNLGKWQRLPRERYSTFRKYPEVFETVEKDVTGVRGWTHNPFVLVTSALGSSESSDCLFEWEITFCWPIEMDLLYGTDNMAVVNVMAETMTPGGKVETRPTHVFLTKELFTRNGSYGYYSFRYQSKNGAGNRERLHIWSDSYIAISSLSCEYKVITQRRNEQLTQQLDVQGLREL